MPIGVKRTFASNHVDTPPASDDDPGMEDLSYFVSNPPGEAKPRTGRLTTAGIVFVLAAVPLLWIVVMLLRFAVRWHQRVYPTEWAATAVVIGAAGLALAAAIGLLMRLRWSRPLGLAAATMWLSAGSTGVLLAVLDDVLRRFRFGAEYAWRVRLEYDLIPYAIYVVIWVGLPAFVRFLLRPDDVRRTLERIDLAARWTDPIGPSRLSLAANFLLLTIVTVAVILIAADDQWAREYAPAHVALGIVAPLLLLGAVLSVRGGRTAILPIALFALAVSAWAGWMSATPFGYRGTNETPAFCYLIVLSGVVLLQALRLRRTDAAVAFGRPVDESAPPMRPEPVETDPTASTQ